MQVSLTWINEIINIETININTLIEKLTLGGFEVEKIIELEVNNQKELSLEISATANRSDSLSIQGISREISALLNRPNNNQWYLKTLKNWKNQIKTKQINFVEKQDCSTFMAILVENVETIESPKWIKTKLLSSGITPNNNLFDFQEFILLETGYLFSFYDFDKIKSTIDDSRIQFSITKAKKNQKFSATNLIDYTLDDSIILVNVNDKPISIGGIIEHQDFEASSQTKSLLIEGSIFNATKIRQQSRHLGLRTNKSARYEKSLKNTYLIESLYRLINLLRSSNLDIICKLYTNFEVNKTSISTIRLHYSVVNEILGPTYNQENLTYLDPQIINNYLTRLGFQSSYDNQKFLWDVEIPHSRIDDITREIDLIEEIGRLHGFNNFLPTLPTIARIGKEDISYITRKKLTNCLLNLGFNELIHYSLVPNKTIINNEIKIINPSVSEYSSLRKSLLPNLLKTVQENIKQGNLFIDGFEYGHIFFKNPSKKFQEKEYISGIFNGKKNKEKLINSNSFLTWFEAKGKIEHFFEQLNLSIDWKPFTLSLHENILHPYCSANLYFPNKIKVGIFGQIHPLLANKLGFANETYLFEFDMRIIQSEIKKNKLKIYKSYSVYPKIIKDLSFTVNRAISFAQIQEILYLNGSKFLIKVNLLDEYRGNSIPTEQTNLCLELIFKSQNETLENKKVELITQHLQNILINKFNVIMRY